MVDEPRRLTESEITRIAVVTAATYQEAYRVICQLRTDLAAVQAGALRLHEVTYRRAIEAEQRAAALEVENERLRNLYTEPKVNTPERWQGKPEDKPT